jgi:hypothetical protein
MTSTRSTDSMRAFLHSWSFERIIIDMRLERFATGVDSSCLSVDLFDPATCIRPEATFFFFCDKLGDWP